MNVLLVALDFFPNLGGISVMTHHLANEFHIAGHQTSVICPKNYKSLDDFDGNYDVIIDNDSNTRNRSGNEYESEILRLEEYFKEIITEKQADLVILMHPYYYGLPLANICNILNVNLTTYYYGFEVRSQIIEKQKSTSMISNTFSVYSQLKEIIKLSNVNLSISRATKKEVDSIYFNASNSKLLGCAIPNNVDMQKSVIKLDYKKNIVFVGRLVESKNVMFFVELAKNLPEYGCHIIGFGPQEDDLVSKCQEYNLSNVTFWGRVSEDKKNEILQLCELLVLPSQYLDAGNMEGFGIVMLEAVEMGCNVAISNQGGMKDFVLNCNGIYVDLDDAIESSEYIATFLEDSKWQKRFLKNAKTKLNKTHRYSYLVNKIMEFNNVN